MEAGQILNINIVLPLKSDCRGSRFGITVTDMFSSTTRCLKYNMNWIHWPAPIIRLSKLISEKLQFEIKLSSAVIGQEACYGYHTPGYTNEYPGMNGQLE